MDLIERWFHVAPDGGDGTLELFLALFLPLVAAVILARRKRGSIGAWLARRVLDGVRGGLRRSRVDRLV